MRRVMVAFALVALAILGNGCTTGVVYMTPKDAPHGYVEFYAVPSYAEALNMPIGIDVTVAQTIGGERKVLGKSLGGILGGTRVRVACAPGKNEFQLKPVSRMKHTDDHKWVSTIVDVRQDMVTPVRANITVTECESAGTLFVKGLVVGPALRKAATTEPTYEMSKVDVIAPQPYYEYYSMSRNFKGGTAIVEAYNRQQAETMMERVATQIEGLDLLRKEDRDVFRARYEKARGAPKSPGCLVRAGVFKPVGFSWKMASMMFDE